ncbi:MAG: hypoxanthine phosphoribosyltransferase [Cyclobacteriaceae bacterium]
MHPVFSFISLIFASLLANLRLFMFVLDKEFQLFIPENKIQARIKELAQNINGQYAGKNPLFVAILNGSFIFAADLIREISIPCQISFIKTASYENIQSTGNVRQLLGFNEPLENREVIIIEDIVDTGNTLNSILVDIHKFKPSSVEIATLLFKPEALMHRIKPKFTGFEIPNKFVVGYGLDYNGHGRNLKDIYQLKNI